MSLIVYQLWLEVGYYFDQGETWFLCRDDQKIMDLCNLNHEVLDPVKERLLNTYDFTKDPVEEVLVMDILERCGYSANEIDKSKTTKAGNFLTQLTEGRSKKSKKGSVYRMPKPRRL